MKKPNPKKVELHDLCFDNLPKALEGLEGQTLQQVFKVMKTEPAITKMYFALLFVRNFGGPIKAWEDMVSHPLELYLRDVFDYDHLDILANAQLDVLYSDVKYQGHKNSPFHYDGIITLKP